MNPAILIFGSLGVIFLIIAWFLVCIDFENQRKEWEQIEKEEWVIKSKEPGGIRKKQEVVQVERITINGFKGVITMVWFDGEITDSFIVGESEHMDDYKDPNEEIFYVRKITDSVKKEMWDKADSILQKRINEKI